MIDLRYHVYSLAAVFFALAIGIVIGSSFVGQPVNIKQKKALTAYYEQIRKHTTEELVKQQDALDATRADLARSEKMCGALLPVAFKGSLSYYNVALIQTGDYDDLTANVKASVESVGGRVTSITKISRTLKLDDSDFVSSVLTEANIVPKADEPGRAALIRTIAESVTAARSSDKLAALADRQMITMSGRYDKWNRCVVLIGGAHSDQSSRMDVVDLPLIEKLIEARTTVVGCEPRDAKWSCVPIWKRTSIATVDNVDRATGKIALICALEGEDAHFGQKRTADRLIPEMLGNTK